MKWLIIIVIAGFLYYRFVLVKGGNLKFWKFAKAHPDEVYSFFTGNDDFVVFDSKPRAVIARICPRAIGMAHSDYMSPRNKFVTIFGRSPEYQIAQEDFMRTFHE